MVREIQSLYIVFGSRWVLYQAAEIGQLSFNGGLDTVSISFFSPLHWDVLFGSYYLCYPRPELIWHRELVGVMPDLVPFLFFGLDLLFLC